jgi:hypothetical protein
MMENSKVKLDNDIIDLKFIITVEEQQHLMERGSSHHHDDDVHVYAMHRMNVHGCGTVQE